MKFEKLTCYGSTALLLLALPFGGCSSRPTAAASEEAAKRVSIRTTPAEVRLFEKTIAAQGTLNAKRTAMVPPLIDGTITSFFVEVGDAVKAGETKLFQIDKIKVERALAVSEQNLALARSGKKDAEAQLASVQAQYDKAHLDYERYTRLYDQKAITPDAMEKAESGFKVASAGLERARVGVQAASEQLVQAEASVEISRKTLKDSLIYAPMDGIVSARLKEEGEFGAAGAPLIRIVDPGLLELSAFLPGEYYAEIIPGETQLQLSVQGIDLGVYPVSFKSPEIQAKLRNFEVRCLVPDPPAGVAPGAEAKLSAVLFAREGVGIPSTAIQRRGGKEVVFTVSENRTRGIEIVRGLESAGWTEITNDALTAGMQIVTMGQFLVEDGTQVSLSEEGA